MTSVDPAMFRKAAGLFATGVLVITTGKEGDFRAVTVNSFTTVSLDPTLLLFCLDNKSRTLPKVQEAGSLTVNVLKDDQEHISRMFAGGKVDNNMDDVEYEIGLVGTPVIAGCLAHFQCRVEDTYLAGDHTIVIARVEAAELGDEGRPLLFYKGKYGLES